MTGNIRWALVFALTLGLPATSFAADNDPDRTGKQLYYDHGCYACHGYQGIGRHNIANGVSGIASNEQVFLIYLRARGEVAPGNPVQTMPNYPENTLSDADARKILAYIKTFVDEPPVIEEVPVLRQILEDAENLP